jgi:hypothetical protein
VIFVNRLPQILVKFRTRHLGTFSTIFISSENQSTSFTLTPPTLALLERLLVAHLHKNFLTVYRTTPFTIVFTRALHWATTTHYLPPHCVSLWSILILSSHLHLRLHVPSGLLPSSILAFPSKSYMHSASPPCVLHTLPISPSTTSSF